MVSRTEIEAFFPGKEVPDVVQGILRAQEDPDSEVSRLLPKYTLIWQRLLASEGHVAVETSSDESTPAPQPWEQVPRPAAPKNMSDAELDHYDAAMSLYMAITTEMRARSAKLWRETPSSRFDIPLSSDPQ